MEQILTGLNKLKLGLINEISDSGQNVLDETSFYDLGHMQSKLSRIKQEMASVAARLESFAEIKNVTPEVSRQRTELIAMQRQLIFNMIFYMSNNFKNLDNCILLGQGYNFEFMQCVEALIAYDRGNRSRAYLELQDFFKKNKRLENHFLVNKVFGLLLLAERDYENAAKFLSYAHEFMPGDRECLLGMRECYLMQGKDRRAAAIQEILSMLEE